MAIDFREVNLDHGKGSRDNFHLFLFPVEEVKGVVNLGPNPNPTPKVIPDSPEGKVEAHAGGGLGALRDSFPKGGVIVGSPEESPLHPEDVADSIGELELLRKKEADLLDLYLAKKSALIQSVCLNAIIE